MGTRWPETCWATYKGEINIILKVTSSWSLYPRNWSFKNIIITAIFENDIFLLSMWTHFWQCRLANVATPDTRVSFRIILPVTLTLLNARLLLSLKSICTECFVQRGGNTAATTTATATNTKTTATTTTTTASEVPEGKCSVLRSDLPI